MLSTYISIELFILSVLQKKMNNNFSAEKNIPFKQNMCTPTHTLLNFYLKLFIFILEAFLCFPPKMKRTIIECCMY
ncbi:uncharacterized protein DC041_0001515 [Schistosoma bovis]|uniref:Uncharacterized protein n=1 Tax=Schistosoma bovis TaxID=6184 RepID=A0A430QMI6_SCHBO|nr:uncharacterized protein DC041_0001515 [Schistosoma bovis]